MATSSDGINWTTISTPYNSIYSNISFVNGKFFALTARDTSRSGVIVSSDNGVSWSIVATIPADNWSSIIATQNLYIAIAYGSSAYYTSPNGITWTRRTTLPSTRVMSICYGNYKVVGCGLVTSVVIST
jgi:photosystem II stability/assembly factor-like uncharacterized protein